MSNQLDTIRAELVELRAASDRICAKLDAAIAQVEALRTMVAAKPGNPPHDFIERKNRHEQSA